MTNESIVAVATKLGADYFSFLFLDMCETI